MLLGLEQGIRARIYMIFMEMPRLIYERCMKDYDTNKEPSNLIYWHVNNFYGWEMSQRLPVGGFEWTENTAQFYVDLIKSFNEDSDIGYFVEVDFQYPEKLKELHNDFAFLL